MNPTPPETHAEIEVPTGHQIRTDRPCARCGFNLFGQQIVREPRYGLIAARCPECGQLAALQEYPSLGRWAGRWSGVLAALWVLVVLGAMAVQFGITFGLLAGTSEFRHNRLAQRIADAYQADQAAQAVQTGMTVGGMTIQGNFGPWTSMEADWWLANRDALVNEMGGPWAMVNWGALFMIAPLAVVSLGFGAFWPTALLGAKRRHAAVLAVVPIAVAAMMTTPFMFPMLAGGGGWLNAREAYSSVVMPIVLPICIGSALVVCLCGVAFGRSIARTLVRLALPPRKRAALGVLWTRDGLELPRPGPSDGARPTPT